MNKTEIRADLLAQIKIILYETGGADADDDYYKGWDAAIDEIERRVDKLVKPEEQEYLKECYIDIVTNRC